MKKKLHFKPKKRYIKRLNALSQCADYLVGKKPSKWNSDDKLNFFIAQGAKKVLNTII